MLKIIQRGEYKLTETKEKTKIITLDDNESFAWIIVADIGEISMMAGKLNKEIATLATGKYRLYEVEKDGKYSDQLHLELSLGLGNWQGYLLPEGLPDDETRKNRIIPTDEVITKTNNCSENKCGC